MGKDLRLFLLAVGLPALVVAGAGICLIRFEIQRNRALQEERLAKLESERREREEKRKDWKANLWERRHQRFDQRFDYLQRKHPPEAANRFLPRIFSPEESVATERIAWIGGCLFVLLILSFGAGGWILVRSVRRAKDEALKKTDFLSNISHEFKTPLTTICLCAELAQDDGLSPAMRKKALGSISSEAMRLKELVLNALDFSRLEKNRRSFSMGQCDLAKLLLEAASPLSARFSENGLKLPDERVEVRAIADAGAFKQICVILLDNAAKYAAKDGSVEVAFAPAKEGMVKLEFSDHGPGLGKEGLKRAFDRFWRGDDATTAETGGSGLGLSIARSLARGMGGDLSVSPRKGGGLVFTLELKK